METIKETENCLLYFKLNPVFRIRFKKPIIIDLLLEGKSFELPSMQYFKLLSRLSDQQLSLIDLETMVVEQFSVNIETAKQITENLICHKILVQPDYRADEVKAANHWNKRGWLDALILHLRTRNISFSDNQATDPDAFNAEMMQSKLEQQGPPEFWTELDKPSFKLLPPSDLSLAKPFDEALLNRRSHFKWRGEGIRLQEISDILYYGSFEAAKLRNHAEKNINKNPEMILNSSFSALETYLFVFNIDSFEPGFYHYNLKTHELALIKKGLFRDDISKMCIGQHRPGQADCALVITTKWKRYMYRYAHARAYRTLLINTAELAQKYITLASSYGLVTFLTPAFEDSYAEALLEVNGYEESPQYLLAFG